MTPKVKILLFIGSVLFSLTLLEFFIRGTDLVRGYGFFSTRRSELNKGLRRVIPFRTFGVKYYKTENGIRYISSRHEELYPLKRRKNTIRIVVFGGSTTQNMRAYEESGLHYAKVLESTLQKKYPNKNIEAINLAYSGYATPHSLILFELDVLSWEPDFIIVSHNANDLMTTYWPDFTFDYSNKYGHTMFTMPDYKSVYTPMNVLFQHSQLYWVIKERLENLFKIKKVEYPPIQRKPMGEKLPQESIDVFQRNLKSFAALAKANGIGVIFGSQALIPDEEYFIRHMRNKPYNNIVVYPTHAEFVNHHNELNQSMEAVANETGALFVDNDADLRRNPDYFFDFIHYSVEGVKKLGQNYANHIIESGLLSEQ